MLFQADRFLRSAFFALSAGLPGVFLLFLAFPRPVPYNKGKSPRGVSPLKKRSLSQQAADTLYEMIADDGVWRPGDQLPSEIDLAAQLGISRATLYRMLERKGM